MKKFLVITASALLLLSLCAARWMDEGMWMLDSIAKLPLQDLKKRGLELTPEQIYSMSGASLKDAIVLLGGGTGSFVSAEGLLLTNHHVAFAGIQALSSLQDDYLKNGFWAKSKNEELPTSYTAQIVVALKDVTGEIQSALSDTMSAETRAKVLQTRSREIENAAKGTSDVTCRVSETFNGVKYYLFTYLVFPDVRLVYAPPGAIGNFGGEVDNWIWPRHTGDFSFMRVYTGRDGKPAKYSPDNVPYRPRVFLPLSNAGYTEGSFAMILGFPARTFRYREGAAVQIARDETLPTTVDLYKTRINIIENAGKKDRAIEIKYANRLRSLANTYKNYLGTLEGMRRSGLLSKKRNDEIRFEAYLHSSPDLSHRYGTLLADMEKASAELKTFNRKSLLLANLASGVDLLRLAGRLKTFAGFFRDSAGVSLAPSATEREKTREFIGGIFKNFDVTIDKQTLTALILKGCEMPPDQQLSVFREMANIRTVGDREEKVRTLVNELYDESLLTSPAGCEQLITKGAEAINEDPFVTFSQKIDAEQGPITAKAAKFNARMSTLREKYVAAWLSWKKGETLYPDANRSIRFTYGQVKGFAPRDAVVYLYTTTLTGVMEKEQNEEPFLVPGKLKDLWLRKDYGRYADARDGELHVAFLADLDITGGNSGSPVLNGKGELIGCAFDGNWEAVVGDYYFQEQYNRTISVDIRYVLFVLDKFSGAENILKELVIH